MSYAYTFLAGLSVGFAGAWALFTHLADIKAKADAYIKEAVNKL